MSQKNPPVAVIGAGPIGLAAAAHLIKRGENPLILEAGDAVGHTIRQWHHVAMFSPWEFNTDKAAVELLRAAGWEHPEKAEVPTGAELIERYLEPLGALPAIAPHIRFGARVVAVSRKGFDKVRTAGRTDRPFVLHLVSTDGAESVVEAKAVIDASGTWTSPNPAGADGIPAIGEHAAAERIFYGIPDVLGAYRQRYAGETVMVVGGGHSALNALIQLAELRESDPATRILWVMRKDNIESVYGGEDADALPARGALGSAARQLVETRAVEVLSPFRIACIDREANALLVNGDHGGADKTLTVGELIVATGFRPDLSFLREIRLTLDPSLESSGTIGPLIDPNLHSCGTVRPHGANELAHAEPGFFIVGMKSYGRAPTFLLATGHEQARSVVAALTGDPVAAARVELTLPETGVCNAGPPARKTQRIPETALAEAGVCGNGQATQNDVVFAPAKAKAGCCAPRTAA